MQLHHMAGSSHYSDSHYSDSHYSDTHNSDSHYYNYASWTVSSYPI